MVRCSTDTAWAVTPKPAQVQSILGQQRRSEHWGRESFPSHRTKSCPRDLAIKLLIDDIVPCTARALNQERSNKRHSVDDQKSSTWYHGFADRSGAEYARKIEAEASDRLIDTRESRVRDPSGQEIRHKPSFGRLELSEVTTSPWDKTPGLGQLRSFLETFDIPLLLRRDARIRWFKTLSCHCQGEQHFGVLPKI